MRKSHELNVFITLNPEKGQEIATRIYSSCIFERPLDMMSQQNFSLSYTYIYILDGRGGDMVLLASKPRGVAEVGTSSLQILCENLERRSSLMACGEGWSEGWSSVWCTNLHMESIYGYV